MIAVAIIPARYASKRLPGKPLFDRTGKYLIQHVYERVSQAHRLDKVIVATDDKRIAEAVDSFGGLAAMTSPAHPSGTDRVAEVAATLEANLIVNVQGDEPEIEPAHVDRLVDLLTERHEAQMATLACPFPPAADPADPNAVKVVVDASGRAIYFSRSLIPYPRDQAGKPAGRDDHLLHIGIYAYRRDFLLQLANWPVGRLEQIEKLEQAQGYQRGATIAVGLVDSAAIGIDTPADYEAFMQRCRAAVRDA